MYLLSIPTDAHHHCELTRVMLIVVVVVIFIAFSLRFFRSLSFSLAGIISTFCVHFSVQRIQNLLFYRHGNTQCLNVVFRMTAASAPYSGWLCCWWHHRTAASFGIYAVQLDWILMVGQFYVVEFVYWYDSFNVFFLSLSLVTRTSIQGNRQSSQVLEINLFFSHQFMIIRNKYESATKILCSHRVGNGNVSQISPEYMEWLALFCIWMKIQQTIFFFVANIS